MERQNFCTVHVYNWMRIDLKGSGSCIRRDMCVFCKSLGLDAKLCVLNWEVENR